MIANIDTPRFRSRPEVNRDVSISAIMHWVGDLATTRPMTSATTTHDHPMTTAAPAA